jgi:hypothetical protein
LFISLIIPTHDAPTLGLVIAGLDPAIHRIEIDSMFLLDARVKPAHDESEFNA